ncbi:MAG: hypothetical protein ACM3ZQ_04810, partial [Bacillota bacterium]
TGYRIDPSQQNQLVTTAQAHAYSEVLFDKLVWVTFDATGSYRKPPIATHISIAKAPESLVAGETAQIEGLVTGGEGQPLDKVGVTISLRSDHSEKLIGQGITKDGKFLIDALVPQDFVPGDYALAATVLPSTSRQGSADSLTRPVFAHTEIRLEPLPTTRSLKLPLSGQLLQQGTEHSLGHQQMAATLATKEPLTQAQVTAEDGRFATEIKFEPSAIPGELPTKLKYKVSFPGQGHYLPSEAEGEITIPQSGDRVIPDQSPDAENTAQQPLRPWWTNALVVVGLLALLIIAWLARHHLASLLRRHKIRPTSPEPLTPGPSPGITIDFPEIEPDLPLVWGIDEPILIRVHTVSGEPPAAPLELVADAGYPYQVSSASVDHTACFASIGEHTFYLRSNGRQMASRTIKIVSYRDEIIEGGQKLYQASGGDEAHLNGRLTPREFAQLVLAKGRELPALLTRAFVDLFEQATYSLEPISRRHYIQFYRACNAILNGPQPTTQSPQ